MVKRIAVLGTDGGVSFSGLGFETALTHIGMNTGNALFQFAIWRRIGNSKFTCHPWDNPASVREKADVLVIPAANQIHPSWDLSGWADFVEQCDLPVVCIGLGAQARLEGDARIPLKEGSLRYFKALSARTENIGVRGPFTKKVLEYHGIRNVEVTGCPSQTINPAIDGASLLEKIRDLPKLDNPLVGWTFGTLEEDARTTEKLLSRFVRLFDHRIIFQTDKRILGPLFERSFEDSDYLGWVRNVAFPDIPSRTFADYLLRVGRFYSDARSWIDDMRRFDLVLGMRIHGCVAAVQSGRLGICVAFDSRTRELAETMGYPFLEKESIAKIESLDALSKHVVFSADRFDELKQVHVARIDRLLASAGCELVT